MSPAENLKYTLKRRRFSRGVRISVSRSGDVLVTAPKWIPLYVIERTLNEKQEWISGVLKEYSNMPKLATLGDGKMTRRQQEDARVFIENRLAHWNAFYNFSWGRVSIRDAKTRWGSCSKKRNLNFSYKVALLPPELADYIVVHELCHLKEFNHSKAFWELVERAIPGGRVIKKKLREYTLS